MSNTVVDFELQQDQEIDISENTNAETAIYELLDRQGSGFIREGTEKMAEPDELNVAAFRQILNRSAFNKKIPAGKGKTGTINKRIAIRYMAGSETIFPDKQDEAGVEPNAELDRIVFKNGRLIVVNEGDTVALFEFLRKSSYNATNPDRIEKAERIYKEIFPEKENEDDNITEFSLASAISYIEELLTDKTPGKFKYDEPRLDALAHYHQVVSDTPGGKIKGLIAVAKLNPTKFLSNSKQFEQATLVDISHGEKLGVLAFEETRVILVPKNIVLKSFSNKVSKEDQYRILGGYFSSFEGADHLKEFRIELRNAKEQNMNK